MLGHPLWQETPFVAPAAWEAIGPLVYLAILVFALAWVWTAHHIVTGLGGFIGKIVGYLPFGGSAASAFVHQLEQIIVSPLASAEATIDNRIGVTFHKLARVVDHLAATIEAAAQEVAAVGILAGYAFYWIIDKTYHGAINHALSRAIHSGGSVVHKAIKTGEATASKVAHVVVPRVDRIARSVAVDIPHELDRLRTKERALAHEVDVVIPRDLAGLRARERALEDGAISTFRWLRSHPTAAASTAFAGAVAIALQRLGLGWTRCNNWRGLGKAVCGLPSSLLNDLLAGVFDVLLLSDLCEIVYETTQVAQQFEPVLTSFVGVADGLIGCHGVTKPAAWQAQGVGLAPVASPLAWGPGAPSLPVSENPVAIGHVPG